MKKALTPTLSGNWGICCSRYSDQQIVFRRHFTERFDHVFYSTQLMIRHQNIFCLEIILSQHLAIFAAGLFSGNDQSRTCFLGCLHDRWYVLNIWREGGCSLTGKHLSVNLFLSFPHILYTESVIMGKQLCTRLLASLK